MESLPPYTIYVGSHRPNYVSEIQKILPQVIHHDGTGYPSFSKLVNDCIRKCPTETFIFLGDKARPTQEDINKLLKLLNSGYAFVALFRFACFGFRKQLIRSIGFLDEKYVGGGYEDNDMYLRLREADYPVYISEEVKYTYQASTWSYRMTRPYHNKKWSITVNTIFRNLPETISVKDIDIPVDVDEEWYKINWGYQNWNLKTKEPQWYNTSLKYSDSYFNVGRQHNLGCQSYVSKIVVDRSNTSKVPIHLRDTKPGLYRNELIQMIAKLIKPNRYLEFGCMTDYNGIKNLVNEIYCVSQKKPQNADLINYLNVTAIEYIEKLKTEVEPLIFDLVFLNSDFESELYLNIFDGILPFVEEDGMIILYNTYPINESFIKPRLCGDVYLVADQIKNKYTNCEILTIPVQPGVSIVRKRTKHLNWKV